MGFAAIVKLVLLGGVTLTVFAVALRARPADLFYLFRNWRLGLRAFVAMFVIVPLIAIVIARALHLEPAVEIAIVALALSPVPPLLPGKQLKAGGSRAYVTGLLAAAALVSLIVVPVGFEIVGRIFGFEATVSFGSIVQTLLISIAIPFAAGLVCARLFPDSAERVGHIAARAAGILLILGLIALLVALAPAIWEVIGNGTILVLLAMTLVGVVTGYMLAGDPSDDRAALALAAASRHPGIALALATANFPEEKLAPAAIVLAALIGAFTALPFLKLLARPATQGGTQS